MKLPLLAKIRTRKVSTPPGTPFRESEQLIAEVKRLILARQAAIRKTAAAVVLLAAVGATPVWSQAPRVTGESLLQVAQDTIALVEDRAWGSPERAVSANLLYGCEQFHLRTCESEVCGLV